MITLLVIALIISLVTHAIAYRLHRQQADWHRALCVATVEHFRQMSESHKKDQETMQSERDAAQDATKKRAAGLMAQGCLGLSVAYKDAAETVDRVLVQGKPLDPRVPS